LACSDPLQAALIAKSEELDIAILDYEMPEMNGAELAAFCKAANPDIKVIVFSGALGVSGRELTFADRWVEKANGIEILLETMETLLAPVKAQSLAARKYRNDETLSNEEQ
jgi:CheY-like chemotaxis protein